MSVTAFLSSIDPVESIVKDFHILAENAEGSVQQEYESALCLQAACRRVKGNSNYCHIRRCSISLQRCTRGHNGRTSFLQACDQRDEQLQLAFFNAMATLIQKSFRGYYSRKYKHNYHLRKSYIASITLTGEELRQDMELHFEKLLVEEEEKKLEQEQEKFETVASGLHHLLSTKVQKGIFQSPYHMAMGTAAFGLPVEEHLKAVGTGTLRRTLLQTRGEVLQSRLHQSRQRIAFEQTSNNEYAAYEGQALIGTQPPSGLTYQYTYSPENQPGEVINQ